MRTKEEKAAYMRKYRQLRPGESSQYTTKWAREHREQDRKLKEKSRNKKRAELGLLGWTLKTKYHLTIEQYNVILEKQNGVCAICRKPPTPQKRLCGTGEPHASRAAHTITNRDIHVLIEASCSLL